MPTAALGGCGKMREALTLQTNTPPMLVVLTLTRQGSTGTAVTRELHQYQTGDYVFLTGVVVGAPAEMIRPKISVTDPTTFSFAVPGGKPVEASPEMVTWYAGDPQTGRREFWRTVVRVRAAMDLIRTYERLERGALRSAIDYRFRIYRRADITATMRALWTPATGGPERILTMVGKPIAVGDGRRYMDLEMTTGGTATTLAGVAP